MVDKIKVKPEGREGIYLVEPDEICRFVELLPDDQFHAFKGDWPVMIGADWEKESVLEYLRKCDTIGIIIPPQVAHSISAINGMDRTLFDVSEITEEQLDIIEEGPNEPDSEA